MVGTIQKIEYIKSGGEFTTIDGVRYQTCWNVADLALREGITVEHLPYSAAPWNGADYQYSGTIILRIVGN